MKQLLSRRLGGLLLAASLLSSCQQDPSSPVNGPQSVQPLSTGSSPAHPALTCVGSTTSHNASYTTIMVMDTDGSHQTNVYTSSSQLSPWLRAPTWNGDASKVVFIEPTTTTFVGNIKTLPVSVVNGVPKGGTVSTVYTTSASDSMTLANTAFSSTTSVNKIAFASTHATSAGRTLVVSTISASGGTPTVLATSWACSRIACGGLCWNSDDSKIAFTVSYQPTNYQLNWHSVIYIMDASTGAISDSVALPMGEQAAGLDWSRTGQNVLAYTEMDTVNVRPLKYYDVTNQTTSTGMTGSTMSTWSPNNSSILAINATYLVKSPAYSTTSNNVTAKPASFVNWKR